MGASGSRCSPRKATARCKLPGPLTTTYFEARCSQSPLRPTDARSAGSGVGCQHWHRTRWTAPRQTVPARPGRERKLLASRVGLCPCHDFVRVVEGRAVIKHQYRDEERASQSMDFAADLELQEPR